MESHLHGIHEVLGIKMQVTSGEDRIGTGHRSNIVFDGTSEVGCVMPLNNTGLSTSQARIIYIDAKQVSKIHANLSIPLTVCLKIS